MPGRLPMPGTGWRSLSGPSPCRPQAGRGSTPPAGTGWREAWTTRGLRARYCDDILLVYLEPPVLKVTDHRSVQVAPHLYSDEEGRLPVLHWLQATRLEGASGRNPIQLPPCLNSANFGNTLPNGRAALGGRVEDPFLSRVSRVTRDTRSEPCPTGQHGDGRILGRETSRTVNARGKTVGKATQGSWQLLSDSCEADHDNWEHFTRECTWMAGPPHNRQMTGQEVWRRQKTVTDDGVRFGPPQFVSTTCWTGVPPAPPVPEIVVTRWNETSTGACPAGYTGSRWYSRRMTRRSTRFPWDDQPVVQVNRGPWSLQGSNCEPVPEPDDPPAPPPVTPKTPEPPVTSDPVNDLPQEPDDTPPPEEPSVPRQPDPPPEQPDTVPDLPPEDTPDDQSPEAPPEETPPPEDVPVEEPDTDPHTDPDDNSDGPDQGNQETDDWSDDGGDPGFGDEDTDSGLDVDADPGFDDGDGGDGDGGGSCFLTTAIVHKKGLEADDGPTLTALRQFRDTYMQEDAERRELVRLYYRISPAIVSAIPGNHCDWQRIGDRIDLALLAIRSDQPDRALTVYSELVSSLASRWLPEDYGETSPLPGCSDEGEGTK